VGTKKLKTLYVSVMLSIVMLMVLSLSLSVAEAQGGGGAPILPSAFYGNSTIDGKPAPVGTVITAKMDDKPCGNITVAEAGKYGGPGGFDPKLVVVGTAEDENKIISFYVDGATAGETVLWNSGGVKRLDLSVKKAAGGDGEGGAAGAISPKVLIILLIAVVIVAVVIVSVVWRGKR